MMSLATETSPKTDEPKVPQYDAMRLTEGGHVAHIELYGQVYALRITRAGKLILTK